MAICVPGRGDGPAADVRFPARQGPPPPPLENGAQGQQNRPLADVFHRDRMSACSVRHLRTLCSRSCKWPVTQWCRNRRLLNGLPMRVRGACQATSFTPLDGFKGLEDNSELPSSSRSATEPGVASAGRVEVIIGPMFAGKTTELLRRVREFQNQGQNVVLLKSRKDTRYSATDVVAHTGDRMPCHAIDTLDEFWSIDEGNTASVIAIDEAQFMSGLRRFCQEAADKRGRTVLVAGLDGDFQRQKFGEVLDIIPLADDVRKLSSSSCQFCKRPAVFTLRLSADKRQELVGGRDLYRPVCRVHYNSLQEIRDSGSE